MRVAIFEYTDCEVLQDHVNGWLTANSHVSVKDIKVSFGQSGVMHKADPKVDPEDGGVDDYEVLYLATIIYDFL